MTVPPNDHITVDDVIDVLCMVGAVMMAAAFCYLAGA